MTMPTMIGMFNSRSLVMLSIMVALTWASQVTAFASVRTQSFVRSSEFALKAASAQGSYLSSLDTNAVVGPASASTTTQQPVPSAGTSQFLSSETLPLSVADEMASIAVETCKSKGFKPVSVCVLDNSGYVIVSKRCDGCSPIAAVPMAHHKALTCLSFQMSSREYGSKYLFPDSPPSDYIRLLNQVSAVGGQAIGFPGGILLKSKSTGGIIGAIGVSGAASAEDEACALAGVHQSSMASVIVTEPAAPSV